MIFDETWKVASEADRMGYRFQGGTPLDFVPREPPFGAGSDPRHQQARRQQQRRPSEN